MKQYIEIDGQKYRCLVCWNAIAMYLKEKGLEDLSDFGAVGKMSASDALLMMYWALYFGEDSEGRELPFANSQKLGNALGASHMQQFLKIFSEQMMSQLPKNENIDGEPVKKKKFFFLK